MSLIWLPLPSPNYFHTLCTMKNTILENRVGIYLESSSRDNTAHYNNIYNNTKYGIDAYDNNHYTIDARYNWWGNHPTKNPVGEGDEVTNHVLFEPWLDEYGNHVYLQDEPDDDLPNRIPLCFLFVILAGLFTALVHFVHTNEIQLNRR